MSKFQLLFQQYSDALDRFDDVLKQKKNEYLRDAAIQRFEFTFDLSWKVIKAYLEDEQGILCTSPKQCFREAYKQGIFRYDKFWLEMTDWRNQTSHTYDEKMAERLYKILPKALRHFQELKKALL